MNDEAARQGRHATITNSRSNDTTGRDDRHALLERFGRAYGEHRLSVAFTQSTTGDPQAKRCTTTGWQTTPPLADADHGAGMLRRGLTRNPAIVLRPSNLVGLECDTWNDLARIERLRLPATATVRSSEPFKRHFYFRPPADLEQLPAIAFRFESGKITADVSRYFVAPPSLHPSGAVYTFLPGLAVDEIGFATLPADTYRELVRRARGNSDDTRAALQENPDAKVTPGRRREMIFRYGCALRRWTADRDEILKAALEWNRRHCEPPLEQWQVAGQVDGAMKKPGSQAFR
jgi:hypothetical protein